MSVPSPSVTPRVIPEQSSPRETDSHHSPHPDWLQAFWHYDPAYAYDLERFEYWEWSTTDPYYIEDGVRMSPSAQHNRFLRQAEANLLRFLQVTGQKWSVSREQGVTNLPPVSDARRTHYRMEPDLGLWRSDIDLDQNSMIIWQPDNPLHLVLECLSQTSHTKDREDNPKLYRDLGVQEYWICDPDRICVVAVYQRSETGVWAQLDLETGQPVYSRVLETQVRVDPEYGFQCQDPATRRWIDNESSLQEQGRQEGQEQGRREQVMALAEVLCDADQLAALVAELDNTPAVDWPNTATLYRRYGTS